jgi:2-hydroxy-6-oxonona-2,4-dienedioate hydrolase
MEVALKSSVQTFGVAESTSPSLVMLPGLFAGDWIWSAAATLLAEAGQHCVVLRDAYAERKAHLDDPFGALVDDLLETLDEHALTSVFLAGNSVGGVVALEAARRHPERVAGLLLSGVPGLGGPARLGIKPKLRYTRDDALEVARRLCVNQDFVTDEVVSRCLAPFQQTRTIVNIARYVLALETYDSERAVRRLACPAVFVWGTQDQVTPVERLRGLPAVWSRIYTIDHCGHSPMFECAEDYADAVLRFIAIHSPAQAA